MSAAVQKAIDLANRARLDAYDQDDLVLHAAADIAMHGVATAAWLEDVKEKLRARGIVVDELQGVA